MKIRISQIDAAGLTGQLNFKKKKTSFFKRTTMQQIALNYILPLLYDFKKKFNQFFRNHKRG